MDTTPGDVLGRLRAARERLDAKDTAGAVAIYEEVLASAGGRADVLVTISGDLGTTGNVGEIVELIAPRYDARRHGPATGFNLLQAYIALGDAVSAQHVLDLLFELNRPELEERLYGFSNAVADLMLAEAGGPRVAPGPVPAPDAEDIPGTTKVGIATISKPIWFYGLEAAADDLLPPKGGKLRRVSFAQLSLPGMSEAEAEQARHPGSELGLLAYGLPAWLSEMFYFSPAYAPFTAVAFIERGDGTRHPMVFGAEWTTQNLRQLVDNTEGGLDYVFSGSLRHRAGDYELVLRLWEVRKFRERKIFSARWNPATVQDELTKLRTAIGQFMEWAPYPAGNGIAFESPATPREWVEVLGSSVQLFLADKKILSKASVGPLDRPQAVLAAAAPQSTLASLAWLTLRQRAETLGLPLDPAKFPPVAEGPAVRAAQAALAGSPA